MSTFEALASLSVGSNLGNRLANLRTALRHLRNTAELEVVQTSDVFETAPWGVTDQPYFLNACILVKCALPPEELLTLLKGIEAKMGRRVERRWGQRVIDIDILTMDSLVCDTPNLHIPHKDMHRRGFVLVPLAQILPCWVHPVTGRRVDEMAPLFRDPEPVRVCRL
ncbi:MAG: 2-amino-4-hydroxy-6-hydroxymethyldihydropteridine diphosphokinase [Synergistaceae bacterium]|jgi:2-amino-4-hydroxy-6-hydroxymethyldihydropteridine diphosphokinase|nr:2-amino-4-hydroxy-6-hydroxymethyldihydropteridine diphosphokinase [Synergistaceae bacterium]